MNTTELGLVAENAVERFLQNKGYLIIEKNWKTTTCEIDIVARHGIAIHFVEVKYRSRPHSGNGFEYITSQKIKRMDYAARLWSAQNKWYGPVILSGASVGGQDMKIQFIENISG